MLAIQRQVVGELVDQQPGDETHLGAAALDDTGRCTRAMDDLGALYLDHRAAVFEHDIAARTLGEPEALLVTDHLKVFSRKPCGFGGGQLDELHRHPRRVEEGHTVIAGIGDLRCHAPGMGGDPALRRRGWCAGLLAVDRLPQTHLGIAPIEEPLLALLAEELALEPVELMLQRLDFLTKPELRTHQIDDLLRSESRRFIEAQHTCFGRGIHAWIIPVASTPREYL